MSRTSIRRFRPPRRPRDRNRGGLSTQNRMARPPLQRPPRAAPNPQQATWVAERAQIQSRAPSPHSQPPVRVGAPPQRTGGQARRRRPLSSTPRRMDQGQNLPEGRTSDRQIRREPDRRRSRTEEERALSLPHIVPRILFAEDFQGLYREVPATFLPHPEHRTHATQPYAHPNTPTEHRERSAVALRNDRLRQSRSFGGGPGQENRPGSGQGRSQIRPQAEQVPRHRLNPPLEVLERAVVVDHVVGLGPPALRTRGGGGE